MYYLKVQTQTYTKKQKKYQIDLKEQFSKIDKTFVFFM